MRSWKKPFWASVGQILPYWATERLEHSMFQKQDALFTLVNRWNWVWKGSSSYSNHKKKWRPPSVESVGVAKWSARLQTTTTPLLQVQFSHTRHLHFDKRMIFPTIFLHTQCNEKWQSYGCSKGLRKARRVTRMIMTRHRTKREGHNIANGLELHEVTWCEFMQLRTSFEIASCTTTGKAKASWVRRQG